MSRCSKDKLLSFDEYISARLLEKTDRKGSALAEGKERQQAKKIKKQTAARRRLILILTLVFVLGILITYKVLNHFTEALAFLTGLLAGAGAGDVMTLVMPLGISYYTFSIVGYLLDIYWKRYEAEKKPLRFYLYTIYFPHIMRDRSPDIPCSDSN